jgi:hypothetical protein
MKDDFTFIFRVEEYIMQETRVKQVASMTLKMEATRSSEASVDFKQTTPCFIPEDGTFNNFT